jgi:hypothetical protein
MALDKKDEELKGFLNETEQSKEVVKNLFQEVLIPLDENIKNIDKDFKCSLNEINKQITILKKQIETINKDISGVLKVITTFETKNNYEFNKIGDKSNIIEKLVSTISSEQKRLSFSLEKTSKEFEENFDLRIYSIEKKFTDQLGCYLLMEHIYLHIYTILKSCKKFTEIKKHITEELPDLLKSDKIAIEKNAIREIFNKSVKESKHWWGISVSELKEILMLKLRVIFLEEFQKNIK